MRKVLSIFWGVLALLYSIMYVQHEFKAKQFAELRHATTEPPFSAQVDMSVDGMSIYSAHGIFFCLDDVLFRLVDFRAREKLQAVAHNYAGKKVKLTFRREHILLKEGYAIIPNELNGYYIIFHETHEEEADAGVLSATDELLDSDIP